MKIIKAKAFHFKLVFILFAFLTGCVASRLQIVKLNLEPQPGNIIEIMPISAAKDRVSASDAAQRGLIGVLIDETTGIYTYNFDDEDYYNLRKSLIQSLQLGNYFSAVYDVANVNKTGKGIRLYINFNQSGIKYTYWQYYCFLDAYSWTEDANGNVLSKKDIYSEGGGFTVSGAKNKTIKKFINEVASLISMK